MAVHKFEAEVAGRRLYLETGRLAEQAHGAVLVQYGDSALLATVIGAYESREGTDFLPLTVDYEERMYAAGKIPGGFIKREGRPSEDATLTSRLTDRSLRPLFPKGYYNEIQVMLTVMAADQHNDPDILSIIGSSAAICISDLPFKGPIGAARVGYIDGEFILNPTFEELAKSRLDLVVAGSRTAVMMVEAGANELTEEQMLDAVKFGHDGLQHSIDLQEQMIAVAAKTKRAFEAPVPDTSTVDRMKELLGERLVEALQNRDKTERESNTDRVKAEVFAQMLEGVSEEDRPKAQAEITKAFNAVMKAQVRDTILDKDVRPDGRSPQDIRQITVEVGVLPTVHGTGLFTRGQTQVMTVITLGTGDDEQMLDNISPETKKRYIHHYNFPPYSTGEVRRMRGPSRRDIGHGNLAERSLLAVLPSQSDFPYTLRLVSEVLSSNGSSSMASVCGSSLALMDAGVPIRTAVAGVAMGLITAGDGRTKVLTDIQGIEDQLGDMDFKVAGTADGITGLQMDIKTTGLTYEIMGQAFAQAREARLFILDKMNAVISEARPDLAASAPRIIKININPEKIGALIGPGGKMIRSITEQTGTKIDVEDDGSVFVASSDGDSARRAIQMIEALTKEAEIGQIYLGKVVSLQPYGAFVQIIPGKDGLVRISELADYHVENVEDVVSIGDEINVMVTGVDRSGKISLSRRAVLTGESPSDAEARARESRPAFGSGGGDRGRGGPGGDRGPRDDRPRDDRGPAPRGDDRGGAPRGDDRGGAGRSPAQYAERERAPRRDPTSPSSFDRDRGGSGAGAPPSRGPGYGDRGPLRGPSRGPAYGDSDRGPARPPTRGPGFTEGDRGPTRGPGYGGGTDTGGGSGDRFERPERGNERGPADRGPADRDRGPRW